MADWGDTTLSYTGGWNGNNLFAYLGGTSPAGTNQLDSVTIDSNNTETYRVAVYSGGSVDDPSGATLLEDLGTFAHGGTGSETINSTTNPTLPDSGRIWIAIKSDAFDFPERSGVDNLPEGDFDSIVNVSGNNSNGAWDDPAPTTTYNAEARSAGVFLTYSAAGGGGVSIPVLMHHYRHNIGA